jgi:thymidylate synthase (FAD)
VSVELIGSMGGDLSVVNAARVSFHKRSEEMGDRERGLVRFLMENRHGTPFEMVQLQFRARTPIGVAREWFRHRIGSFNEESTRYVEMRKEFYIPEPDACRAQVGKPGHYIFERHHDPEKVREMMGWAYEAAYLAYQDLMALGVAKELARNVLPLGLLTEFVWSVNLRSLFNFLSLRTSPHALREIREEAEQVEMLAAQVAPECMAAWGACGRRSV